MSYVLLVLGLLILAVMFFTNGKVGYTFCKPSNELERAIAHIGVMVTIVAIFSAAGVCRYFGW